MTHFMEETRFGKIHSGDYINLDDSEEGKFTAMLLIQCLRKGSMIRLQLAVE